jgi:hypothetical protein
MDDKQMLFFLHNQKCSRGSLAYFIFAHAHVLIFLKYFLVTASLLHSSVITALSLNNHPHLLTISPPPSPPRSCLRSFLPATSSSHPSTPPHPAARRAPPERANRTRRRPCLPAIQVRRPASLPSSDPRHPTRRPPERPNRRNRVPCVRRPASLPSRDPGPAAVVPVSRSAGAACAPPAPYLRPCVTPSPPLRSGYVLLSKTKKCGAVVVQIKSCVAVQRKSLL